MRMGSKGQFDCLAQREQGRNGGEDGGDLWAAGRKNSNQIRFAIASMGLADLRAEIVGLEFQELIIIVLA